MDKHRLDFSELFYDPFDQMLREQLLADQIQKMQKEDDRIDIVTVLHLAPKQNSEIEKITNAKLLSLGETVTEIWGKIVDDDDKFIHYSLEEFFNNFQYKKYDDLKEWWEYISERYHFLKRF